MTEEVVLRVAKEVVFRLIELFDPQKIAEIKVNELVSNVLNITIVNVEIKNFQLSRAEIMIPGYAPGVFPPDFTPIKTLRELVAYAPTVLFAEFTITVKEMSRITAKGIGELCIYRKDNEIKVEARDVWSIEEVMEIDPQRNLEKRTRTLERFIYEVVIKFIAALLAELATKVLT